MNEPILDPSGPGDPRAERAATLDAIFAATARRRPEAWALIDPPDRSAFTDGAPRRLTYAQAERAVAALAARLQALGLPEGSVVALQLPNTAEGVIALLAVLRAGLIAAPLPLLWRQAEAAAALAQVGARALVSCTRVGGIDHAELALQIAADTFCIRFVCAFGAAPPDGVVPLDDIFAAAAEADALSRTERTADDIAVLTFDTGAEGTVPVARSHNELLVGGLATMLEAGLVRHATLLATMLTSSFATLAATLVPWLLTGGTLALHQPFDPAVLAAQSAQERPDALVLPAALMPSLAEAGIVGGDAARPTVIAVWRFPERQGASPHWAGAGAMIDILAFGELGIVALRRGADGKPAALTAGALTAPQGAAGAPVVMTLARTAQGTLALGGPMLPRHDLPPAPRRESAANAEDLRDTGYACRIAPDTGALDLSAGPAGLVSVGGYRFALRELQDVVGRIEPDGVLAALPDLLAGQKLAGQSADMSAMRRGLAALGINPLVGSAFRAPRSDKSKPAA